MTGTVRKIAGWVWRPDPRLMPPARGRFRRLFGYLWMPATLLAGFSAAAAYDGVRPGGEAAAIGIVTALPLLLMRRHSLLAFILTWLVALIMGTNLPPPWPSEEVWPWNPVQPLVLLLILFVLGLRHRTWVLGAAWVLVVLLMLTVGRQNVIAIILLFTLPLLLGFLIRRQFKLGQSLAASEARGSLLTERARIARELHDVVAHHMSMIAVRAETAPYRLSDVDASGKAEFAEISTAARQALTEMRLLLGVLRSDEATAPPTAPQPGLGDLPELVETARHAGAEVELDVDAGIGEVPDIVGVSAYRIVQEALSNVARHAPGGAAVVTVRADGPVLDVRVENTPGTRPGAGGGGGYGLRGAGERAAILGGSLDAHAREDGGYVVLARLPMTEGAE